MQHSIMVSAVCVSSFFQESYLTSGSNLLPNAFKWEILEKLIFFNTVEAKVNILPWYVKTNETMAINKFQRSRLTFQPRSLILESHQHI